MDLGAYMLGQHELLKAYVDEHYGEVPRFRGVRFMKYEKLDDPDDEQERMFASHCGEDVVYIHTRCGGSNYEYFEADMWEAGHDTFIESMDDAFDCTYRDHYFRAVPGDDYDAICAQFEEALKEEACE